MHIYVCIYSREFCNHRVDKEGRHVSWYSAGPMTHDLPGAVANSLSPTPWGDGMVDKLTGWLNNGEAATPESVMFILYIYIQEGAPKL